MNHLPIVILSFMVLTASAFAEPGELCLTPAQQLARLNITPEKYNETLARMGPAKSNSDRLKWLLAAGADPNQKAYGGRTPLHIAIESIGSKEISLNDIELVELLLEAGADPNAQDAEGNTPLHKAVFQPELLPMLHKAGGDFAKLNKEGLPALHRFLALCSLRKVSPGFFHLLLEAGACACHGDAARAGLEVPRVQ